ncbi:MAG: hypothetical protein SCARUB_04597 [Candidatus Scalindua rubra]|uniref:Uncharacterized protein n=1 Tax=Candidatus Scalindua rubra TaxID=1872076 RepID=A0A1E3X421_9BACT|nr:MAG: hypothetical protein SCARUB_04597 [Candidatus Scalindua rubra]
MGGLFNIPYMDELIIPVNKINSFGSVDIVNYLLWDESKSKYHVIERQ